MRDPNRADRILGDGQPSQNALPLKILRYPQWPARSNAANDTNAGAPASGDVCPGDDAAESFVGMVVTPDDVEVSAKDVRGACPQRRDRHRKRAQAPRPLARVGAMHLDPGTKDYKYTRAEVETLMAMTAALLSIVP